MSQPSITVAHVKSFVDHVTFIRGLDRFMNELFQNRAAQAVMNETAPQFMMRMNGVVLNSVIGAMYRITEPAKSHGQQNLTVQTIVKGTQWTEGRDSEAKRIAQRCDGFNQQLKEGRHKLLAHNDLKTALDDQWYPFPLPSSICEDVIEQLESLIKLAYEQFEIPGDGKVILRGDEREFIKRLNDSLLYERVLKDSRLPKELRSDMIEWRFESSRKLFP